MAIYYARRYSAERSWREGSDGEGSVPAMTGIAASAQASAHVRTGADGSGGEVVLRARALTKRYGARTAVDRLNLEVRRGEVFGFLGPNGAGKTTSIRMMLGLIAPTAGSVEILGLDVAARGAMALPRVGALV